MIDFVDAALRYAERGWAVFPLAPRSKIPAISKTAGGSGVHDATTDETVIRQWWAKSPNANIGLACGASGLLVIDLDAKKGGLDSWAELRRENAINDDTILSLTGGGGVHLLFALPSGGKIKNSAGKLGPGVDVKANGGYIVAPPSVHPSGNTYEWDVGFHPDDWDPQPIPPPLLRLLTEGGNGKAKAAPPVEGGIEEGKRNDTLASLAGTMRRRGMGESAILAALLEENASRCDPPLSPDEVGHIAQSVARYEPHIETAIYNYTDTGNARRLVARHGADLRYCHPWRRWLIWDGARWAKDNTGGVMRCAKDTVAAIYAEAASVPDEGTRKAIAKHAMKSESAYRLREMARLAESEPGIPVTPEQLDRDLWRLNVLNGTLDLRLGELLPHQPDDLVTKLAPVHYDPGATCPLWLAFLERIMDGNEALIHFLQSAIGYSLTGDTSEQCLFILYGTGANGKTTLLQTISTLMGDYAQQTPVDTLMLSRRRGIPNDVARLRGTRFVTAQEAGEGQRLAESLVKQMSGGDKLTARFLHAEFFEFTPAFKIFLATNHKPTIRGTDYAMWRRIRLVPFAVTIPPAEQDKELGTKLMAELDGILAWAVRGCLDWQRDGLGEPVEVRQATEAYRSEMDELGRFLNECCCIGDGLQVAKAALHSEYTQWGGDLSKRRFGARMIERGFEGDKRTGSRRVWVGVGLACSEGE